MSTMAQGSPATGSLEELGSDSKSEIIYVDDTACLWLGFAIQKINFYKSIPLPLWNIHCSIPLLDPP